MTGAVSDPAGGTAGTTPSAEWQPALARVPGWAQRVIDDWRPVLIHRRRVTTLATLGTFLALQFLIPARLVIHGMGAVGRPSVAVGILLAFFWLMSAARGTLPRARQPIRWIVVMFVALQLFGYAVGFDRLPSTAEATAADRWLIFVASIAGVTLAVADGLRAREELDRLLRMLVVLSAVMSVTGILQFFGVIDITQYIDVPGLQLNSELIAVGARGTDQFARVAGTANHYIEFGVVLALVLPIALHYAFFARSRRSRIWRWTCAAIIAFGIPLSISRSGAITVVLTVGLLAVVWPWRQRYNALVVGGIAVLLFRLVNPGVLGTIRALFVNAENDPSVLDRIARTHYVVTLWSMRPWLGRGAGMITPEQYILLDNQWYMTLLAGGVVGVLGLAIFFAVPYAMGRSIRLRGRDEETRHLGQALAVTMPGAVLSSGTFDSFSFPTWVGVVCVLMGAIGALWRLDQTTVSRPLAVAAPGDRLVTTPIMARVRARIRDGWLAAAPRNYGRGATSPMPPTEAASDVGTEGDSRH